MSDFQIPDYENLPAPQGYQSYIRTIGPTACDLYALTMTYAAWKLGFAEEKITTSNVFCRTLLDNGETYKDNDTDEIRRVKIPYLISGGLGLLAEWIDGWQWRDDDLRFLAQQRVDNGNGEMVRLFPDEFLYWLSRQRLTLDIEAVPEGQLIFPQEPSLRITGPWWQQMMIEAMALSLISSSTNLNTVATQVRLAAEREARKEGATLVDVSAKDSAALTEMALRRAPSVGALQSARAAHIAGWDYTSNVYAAKCYGIPVKGTFAHAWVMLHDTEEQAFENWAKAHPGSTIFLVDTYDTIEAVEKAIHICRKHGLALKGIRLDSGNTAYLSKKVQPLLDEAGYGDALISDTNNLTVKAVSNLFGHVATDVTKPESFLKSFGLGSEIAVNRNNPLLDFVMKLGALHADASTGRKEVMRDLIKLSETEAKTTLPGLVDILRFIDPAGKWAGDTIIPHDLYIGEEKLERDLLSQNIGTGKIKPFPKGARFERILKPWMRKGEMVQPLYAAKDAHGILAQAKETCKETLARMGREHLRLPTQDNPHPYGVGITQELATKRRTAIERIRSEKEMEKQRARFGLTPT